MDDSEIIINVHKSVLNNKRYVVVAYYRGLPSVAGQGFVERGLFDVLRGRSLDVLLKEATCKAIEDLKYEYGEWDKYREHMKFVNERANLHAQKCLSGDKSG